MITAAPHRGTLEFRCADVGLECRHVATADSEEGLLTTVAQHARKAHGVELNHTLIDYARTKVRAAHA